MSAPIFLLSCTLAVMVQNVYSECFICNSYNAGSCGCGFVHNEYMLSPWQVESSSAGFQSGMVPASDGGGFAVKSASPVPPSGVSILSENEYTGILAAVGHTASSGTAHLEGTVPSAGAGAVTYGCGYGEVAIVSEDSSASGSLYDVYFARTPATAPCGFWA